MFGADVNETLASVIGKFRPTEATNEDDDINVPKKIF